MNPCGLQRRGGRSPVGRLPSILAGSRVSVLATAALFLIQPYSAWSQTASILEEIRSKLEASVGGSIVTGRDGYKLSGRLEWKAAGGGRPFSASILRVKDRWVADFSHEEPLWSVRYGGRGLRGWASSSEGTIDSFAADLPFCAIYDFPVLYEGLIRVLESSPDAKRPRLAEEANALYVQGRLPSGEDATYILQKTDYFPRKVAITNKGLLGVVWHTPEILTSGILSSRIIRNPESETVELWFSNPQTFDGRRFPGQTDFAIRDEVVGSFKLERVEPALSTDPLLIRPPEFPWEKALAYRPSADSRPSRVYFGEAGNASLRALLGESPWLDWARANRLAALVLRLSLPWRWLYPNSPSVKIVLFTVILWLAVWIMLVLRYRKKLRARGAWFAILLALVISVLGTVGGVVSSLLATPVSRSLLTLQPAVRYAATGNPSYAEIAEELLATLRETPRPDSPQELAELCQAYASALDLIRAHLPPSRQVAIEKDLFEVSRPLYGVLQGPRALTAGGSVTAAGLGIVGLAIGVEEYVRCAGERMFQSLSYSGDNGIHREGPGAGFLALDHAADFMAALKRDGRPDPFLDTTFQQHVRASLELLSPLGTLPMLGDTALDDARHAIPFLEKIAAYLPEESANRARGLREAYWKMGRNHVPGVWRWILRPFLRSYYFVRNPYSMLFLEREVATTPSLPGSSAVLGGNRIAVFRSGNSTDSLYLALNGEPFEGNGDGADVLGFDLYAYEALLLHGAGVLPKSPSRAVGGRTASANTFTVGGRGQVPSAPGAGIVLSMLNQPRFDFARALADRAYDQARAQRDVVLIRPEAGAPGYFAVVDEIHAESPALQIEWRLHGLGALRLGFDSFAGWTAGAFSPGLFGSKTVQLVAYTVGPPVNSRSGRGRLNYRNPSWSRTSETLILDWQGSRRLATILYPLRDGQEQPRFDRFGTENAVRIGENDWMAMGDPSERRRIGPFQFSSEYLLVRNKGSAFPPLLLAQGTEFQFEGHAIESNHPVSLSWDGLSGGIRTGRPDTRLIIRSPEIRSGERFSLDSEAVAADADGSLVLSIRFPGEHRFGRFR